MRPSSGHVVQRHTPVSVSFNIMRSREVGLASMQDFLQASTTLLEVQGIANKLGTAASEISSGLAQFNLGPDGLPLVEPDGLATQFDDLAERLRPYRSWRDFGNGIRGVNFDAVLDEPVASVDTRSAALIRKASLAARQNRGTTLVITSHDLPWLFTCSDTQLSINNGALFAAGQEITIPGPYSHIDPVWTRQLDDGQVIQLPAPASLKKTAVIQRKHIHIFGPEKKEGIPDNQIRGKVQSMYITGQHGDIMTTIDAGGISFMLGIPPGQASELNLQPGIPVTLAFNSCDIRWH